MLELEVLEVRVIIVQFLIFQKEPFAILIFFFFFLTEPLIWSWN